MSNVQKGGVIILSQQKPTRVALFYQEKKNAFSFPKGHVEPGETPLQCAIREVKEETGLDVEIIKPLGVCHYHNNVDGDVELFFFLGRSLDDMQIVPEPDSQVIWTDPNEICPKLFYPEVGEFFAHVLETEKEFFI